MVYKIAEIFYSIQGEGLLQGLPFIFLRFSGCNLKCPWCDTKYAWEEGKLMTEKEILTEIEKFKIKRACFTGGEPYLQGIEVIFNILKEKNYWISVETNGTIWKNIKFDWITVSPKIEGQKIHKFGYDQRFNDVANEFKYVILNKGSFNFINRDIKQPVVLQPVDNDLEIAETIVNFLKENPFNNWYLRLQLHKIIKIK
ncbi:MAG: 7-carboxy-7-deazaguanine synthase QueE [Candidatus Omnitrophica bacterium]|nr:7-carboxy-7-deazaguanine synthase QueE [Candidatus Omnitrophota bacterium]MCM8803005.1 7-carboxy-7-deazaguanine synthase QueE [Candidatus Omnitrophota bacterium]